MIAFVFFFSGIPLPDLEVIEEGKRKNVEEPKDENANKLKLKVFVEETKVITKLFVPIVSKDQNSRGFH